MDNGNGFHAFAQLWLPRIENEMRAVLGNDEAVLVQHYGMMQYHMGWADGTLRPGNFPSGKRVRPLLCLMACQAVGGDPTVALPAAAAVEILHNFSLIHDDIEDGDETRRHRPTVWARWGVPQAINAGDGMFALAFVALQQVRNRGASASSALDALDRFSQTCIALTEGQHLDLSFEEREQVSVAEYLRMIEGKTASLIAGSIAIGALLGGANEEQENALYQFGRKIGLAFQIRDDILGIWGDPDVTGKAAGNDILRRKKSLPLLYALEHPQAGLQLQELWRDEISLSQLPAVNELLAQADAKAWAEEMLRKLHQDGLEALSKGLGIYASSSPLLFLADELLERQS